MRSYTDRNRSQTTMRFVILISLLYLASFATPTTIGAYSGFADGFTDWQGSTTGAATVINVVPIYYGGNDGYISKFLEIRSTDTNDYVDAGIISIYNTVYYYHEDYLSSRGSQLFLDRVVPPTDNNTLTGVTIIVDEPGHTTYQVYMATASGNFSYYPSGSFTLFPNDIHDELDTCCDSSKASSDGNGAWSYNQWIDNTYAVRYQDYPHSATDLGNTYSYNIYPPISIYWYSYPPANNPPGGTWLANCCY